MSVVLWADQRRGSELNRPMTALQAASHTGEIRVMSTLGPIRTGDRLLRPANACRRVGSAAA